MDIFEQNVNYLTMKILNFIYTVILDAFLSSATPYLFGSKNRRKAKNAIAEGFKADAAETQGLIDTAQAENPFESAAAKSAMAKASRGAKQMQSKFLNTLGAGATPEAIVSGMGAAAEAEGAAAGGIAAGAEATKENKLAQLRGMQAGQKQSSAQAGMAAADEIGSGWNSMFQLLDSVGGLMEGVAPVL